MTSFSNASRGFGLGLRTAHYQDFLTSPQRVDWLEIITDNFLVDGGKPLATLEKIRSNYPIAMHGVAMSIGSAGGLDRDYVARVKRLAQRIEPMWVSDHLCWTGHADNVLHDLYPMPYTEESARLLIAHIRQAQDMLERRLVIENVSSYVRFPASSTTEWAFLAHVIEEADCELLLDVNNVFVSSINHGFAAETYLDGLPAARVRQIHLAGHSRSGEHIIDTHDQPVSADVWALYASACRRFPQVATMIERDDNIPPLAELIEELDHARTIAARATGTAQPHRAAVGKPGLPAATWTLDATQGCLAQYIVDLTPTALPAAVEASGPLPGTRGMEIYRHAYRARLTEVLADSYPKCQRYLGSELFGTLALDYINDHPPQERNLGRYGADFATALSANYPDNEELSDLARLEWALRAVFDSADVPAWSMPDIERAGPQACLAQSPILHSSVRLLPMRSNAVAIWRAIDADDEVPQVVQRAQALAVWRKGMRPHFKSLEPDEAHFLRELMCEGATIDAVAHAWAATQRMDDPAILGGWLAQWWADELLQRGQAA